MRALDAAGVQTFDSLLVGFSAGRDSVALATMLLEAGFSRFTLLHLDHGLRDESGGDAAWVANFATSRGLNYRIQRTDVASIAKADQIGIEEAGRNARYAFFADSAKALNANKVLVGHHADDQVETFLFRLLRGSGTAGLCGMSASSTRLVNGVSFDLLRPMLEIWRDEIDGWITEKRLDFREDSSNQDLRWTRNRIRHTLIPALEDVMRRPVKAAIWRAAELLRDDDALLNTLIPSPGDRHDQTLEVAALRSAPAAIQRRLAMRWLREQGVSSVGFDIVEAVIELALHESPAKINLPGGAHARRRAGRIFIETAEEDGF
jgi:tRNA(Ile)-lysidine synthase